MPENILGIHPEEREALSQMLGREAPPEIAAIVEAYHDMMATRSPSVVMPDQMLALVSLIAGLRREHIQVENNHSDTPIGTKLAWRDGQQEKWGTFQHVCAKPRGTYCRLHLLDDPDYPRDVAHDRLHPLVERPKLEVELPFEPGTEVVANGTVGIFRSLSPTGRLRVEIVESGMVDLRTFKLDEVMIYEAGDPEPTVTKQGWTSVKAGTLVTVASEDGMLGGEFQAVEDDGRLHVYLTEQDKEMLVDPDDVIVVSTVLVEAT
jgi:hypothetical protein